jgi:tRNA(Ile)-lysidine synthase
MPSPLLHVLDSLLNLTGPKPRVVVAFSGGVDSTVLAHLLAKHRRRFASLRLIHVDHGLQPASGEWALHCQRFARRCKLDIDLRRAAIPKRKGESLEALARTARYELLAAALEPGEVMVTAQHEDDQAETLLLQLLRGAGVAGLASMAPLAEFARGAIARPLLDVSRAALESYAREHKLEWIDDPSNADPRFARNFLRQRVMPALREQWPAGAAAIARSARHMAEAQSLLDGLAAQDLARIADGGGLRVAGLRALPAERRRNAARAFIAARGAEMPSTVKLRQITGELLTARADAQPEVTWPSARMRRRGGRLELEVGAQKHHQDAHENFPKSWHWKSDRECVLSERAGRLVLIDDDAGPIDIDRLPAALEVRLRRGGESLRPGANARKKSLKSLLQGAKLSIEERACMPLVFAADRLIAVSDRWIDASVAPNDRSSRRARLQWRRTGTR